MLDVALEVTQLALVLFLELVMGSGLCLQLLLLSSQLLLYSLKLFLELLL